MIYTVRLRSACCLEAGVVQGINAECSELLQTLDNFYLTAEQLEDSPSRQDGVTADDEYRARVFGCELIQEAGMLLKLPQVTMATGQVLLHRYYCKQSLAKRDVKASLSCLFRRPCLLFQQQSSPGLPSRPPA